MAYSYCEMQGRQKHYATMHSLSTVGAYQLPSGFHVHILN